ncbi:hypothetical protein H6F48_18720 [Limnothrix sp. FACHB-1088]|uniref:hypothetical protein n=1 Tax=Limnothrix sp. FACHB-1088 TaxID=2692816 RepID=UPI0016804BF0|nr:hypothetical protein [Limnothrix sp. FACHB-1088]MBD2193831.1 hypothetical protein [Limnothrix sp. FACHB-1088]
MSIIKIATTPESVDKVRSIIDESVFACLDAGCDPRVILESLALAGSVIADEHGSERDSRIFGWLTASLSETPRNPGDSGEFLNEIWNALKIAQALARRDGRAVLAGQINQLMSDAFFGL